MSSPATNTEQPASMSKNSFLGVAVDSPVIKSENKTFATPALFKDYNKITKDVLTKSYVKPGEWKMESKYVGPTRTVFVNPKADSHGHISADIEYRADCGGAAKVTVTPAGADDVQANIDYTFAGHKIEAVLRKQKNAVDYEISHQTRVVLNKRASINEKLTRETVELGLGYDVAPHCQVGCGATYTIPSNHCNWNFGCRYVSEGREVAIRTNRLHTYQTSVLIPGTVFAFGKSLRLLLGFETNCGREVAKGWSGTCGFELQCPLAAGNRLKARVDRDLKWAATYVAKVSEGWTVAVTLDKNLKAGVLMQHS